jgi:hypothetical protein
MKIEIVREGKLMTDGRLVEPGATRWDDGFVPVMYTPVDSWDTIVIGRVGEIWREDGSIWCEWDRDPKWLSVDSTEFEASLDGELPDRIMRITACRIFSFHAFENDVFPWPDRKVKP